MALRDFLENLTTSGREDSLPYLLRIAGIKAVSTKKADIVFALDKYLSNEQNIGDIWRKLNPFEKDIIEQIIRNEGIFDSDDIKEICIKHNKEYKRYSYSAFFEILDENSPLKLFIIRNSIPNDIFKILKKLVKPIEIKYTPVEDVLSEDEDIESEFVIGDNFQKDLISVIKLVNNLKIRTTKGSGLPTKASALKINQSLEYKEIVTSEFTELDNIRVIEQTNRIYGISTLLISADILCQESDMLTIGSNAEEFLRLNTVDKCKMILEEYIESDLIWEIDRIREIKVKTQNHSSLKSCREVILKYLSLCPVDKWISIDEFLKFIKTNDRQFIIKVVGSIDSYNEYDKYYGSRNENWYQFEGRFIEVALIEYLSTMGIVDVKMQEKEQEDGYIWDNSKYYLSVKYLRLTPLGAHVLGVLEDYTCNECTKNSGFIVQPNYEIVISEGSMRHVHSLFFDRFAEKVSDDIASVYKLSFKSMVTALDNSIPINEIIEYLQEYSNTSIPENILFTLKNWEFESKQIRIRTVTIVETDNVYLMEELKSYKSIKNNTLDELPYVFEIEGKSASKVKREIEKKNHFCIIR